MRDMVNDDGSIGSSQTKPNEVPPSLDKNSVFYPFKPFKPGGGMISEAKGSVFLNLSN